MATNLTQPRYQDYVIKDGQFIGDFENMYKHHADPWKQKGCLRTSYARHATLLQIQKYQIASVAEFGCGLGYFTNSINEKTAAKVCGVDVSPTAVTQAKTKFPHIEFKVGDVSVLSQYVDFEAILFAEISWYILDQLSDVFEQMIELFPNKLFLHNLVFYKGDLQKYGREYFSSFDEFVEFCPFQLLEQSLSSVESESVVESSAVFRIAKKTSF